MFNYHTSIHIYKYMLTFTFLSEIYFSYFRFIIALIYNIDIYFDYNTYHPL